MYKVAILGCENSHADSFLSLIKDGLYPDLEVVGVYSHEEEPPKKLQEKYGVAIMKNYDELIGKVDGIMITARHGDNHYKYAAPYLASGIPMFIDKPITCKEEEAVAFMKAAKENKVRLCGGSVCGFADEATELSEIVKNSPAGTFTGGNLTCPIYMDSVHGGFFFYAQHLVEIMLRVFGADVLEVSADRFEKSLSFVAKYKDFHVTATYAQQKGYYYVSVFTRDGATSRMLTINRQSFCHELDSMLALLKGDDMTTDYQSFIRPVFIMNALLRSAETHTWVPISTPEI